MPSVSNSLDVPTIMAGTKTLLYPSQAAAPAESTVTYSDPTLEHVGGLPEAHV